MLFYVLGGLDDFLLGLGLGVGGFSKASSSLSVSLPLYQSALKTAKLEPPLLVRHFLLIPFRDLSRPLALFGDIVEDLTQFAAAPPGREPINAYVKVLTIVGVGVARVRLSLGLVHLRAIETEHLCNEKMSRWSYPQEMALFLCESSSNVCKANEMWVPLVLKFIQISVLIENIILPKGKQF